MNGNIKNMLKKLGFAGMKTSGRRPQALWRVGFCLHAINNRLGFTSIADNTSIAATRRTVTNSNYVARVPNIAFNQLVLYAKFR
ncbi:MAG: hypothetical protein PHF56_02290 [Desulfuromonadaceae bacterium]|nr:hypothetical protein [Desulfuromonadaceae bacterium]